jgi:hypothetical protein
LGKIFKLHKTFTVKQPPPVKTKPVSVSVGNIEILQAVKPKNYARGGGIRKPKW